MTETDKQRRTAVYKEKKGQTGRKGGRKKAREYYRSLYRNTPKIDILSCSKDAEKN